MEKPMKIVYVAGPLTGSTDWDKEQKIRRAEEISLKIWKLGAVGLCVHTQGRFFQGELDDADWIRGDLAILGRCDAMFLCPGWQWSKGTLEEFDYAYAKGIPIFDRLENLKVWLASGNVSKKCGTSCKCSAVNTNHAIMSGKRPSIKQSKSVIAAEEKGAFSDGYGTDTL